MKPKRRLTIPAISIPLWWPDVPKNLRSWLPSKGNVLFTTTMILMLVWAQTAGAFPALDTSATSTGTIAYQGRLADSGGNPLTTTVNMTFRLYNAATGGTPLWSENWTGSNGVQVSDGLFNVMLGSLTVIPQSVIAGNPTLFLGITAGTDDEMAPRVQLGSVPFAVQALTVPNGSITTSKLADKSVTQAKLGSDVNLNSIESFGHISVDPIQISNQPSVVISKTVVITMPSNVLLSVNSRAISLGGQDTEILFNIERNGIDLASNIHWSAKPLSAHEYFNFTFLDMNLAPGTYTFSLKAVMTVGSGTRFMHQPSISAVVIPNH